MANEAQVALLKRGVDEWNQWHEQDFLLSCDLSEADLSYANLSHAYLNYGNLRHTNLSRAVRREVT